MIPGLRGLAILDNDGRERSDADQAGLTIRYWRRYEAENYFVTPQVLRKYAAEHYADLPLFGHFGPEIDEVLDDLIREQVFGGREQDVQTWRSAPPPTRPGWCGTPAPSASS